jgi:hypothetical protein
MIVRPTITAQAPEGWVWKESITLLGPRGEANVIASSESVDSSMTSETYAAVQGELLKTEFPGYREFSFEPTPLFGDRSGFIRKFEWKPPDGDPVTQYQLYYVDAGRGYTATATTPSRSLHRFESEMLNILRSLNISADSLAQVS